MIPMMPALTATLAAATGGTAARALRTLLFTSLTLLSVAAPAFGQPDEPGFARGSPSVGSTPRSDQDAGGDRAIAQSPAPGGSSAPSAPQASSWRSAESQSAHEYFDLNPPFGRGAGQPDPLSPIMDPINPAKALYSLQKALGYQPGLYSNRPSPSFVEPMFFDLMRPMGALMYNNEVNSLINAFNDNFPNEVIYEFEGAVYDWWALELAATQVDGELHEYLFGSTLTLGVGEKDNWIHALWLQAPIVYPGEGTIGARPLYMFAWKPSQDHPFTWFQASGAERIGVEGKDGDADFKGIWRPMFVFGPYWDINKDTYVGIENHVRPDEDHELYAVLPQVSWTPIEHLTIKAGGGYLRESGKDGTTVMARFMFHWLPPRQPCTGKNNPRSCDRGWQGGIGWLLD